MSGIQALYIKGDSVFHRMSPAVKLLIFVLWSVVVFMFLDIRVSLLLLLSGIMMLRYSAIPFRTIRTLFIVVIVFNLINAAFILALTPSYGTELAGSRHLLCDLYVIKIYSETLFYMLTLSLKYLSLLPMAMIFIFTTYPTDFAASLNKIGLPYKFAYSFSLIFRYIPNIQTEFNNIRHAQAARGLSFGKDEKCLKNRIRNLFSTVVPMINLSIERIDRVANAMDLRCFGMHKSRTWYNAARFKPADYIAAGIAIACFILFIFFKTQSEGRFWYPF